MATTKRTRAKDQARNEETPVLRGVVNPRAGINPRRPVRRPQLANPVTGNSIPPLPANRSQNPRGGF